MAATAVLVAGTAQAQTARAVATIGMIGDIAQNVAGDCVEVETLMGPGIDPHLYQASASDVRLFKEADAILYAGYSLEGQLGNVLAKMAEQKPTVAVSPASIAPDQLITVQDIYGIDPHLWMDVMLWSQIAPTIAQTLAEIVPDCAQAMQDRAAAYQQKLKALDRWVADSLASVPEEQRVLVTAHDAFAYYGRAYSIEVKGIQGISTESEAGIADIRAMVETVVERKVPAVFIESTINPRTIQAVVDSASERGHEVEIGGELYSDAMGESDTAAGTYIGMLRSNTVEVTTALGGQPAPWPDALAEWAEQWQMAKFRGE
jgi:manganese/zinc/iron transport system substrate-binding protein